jgi:hypothetical protein
MGGGKRGIADALRKIVPLDVGVNAGFLAGCDGKDGNLVPKVHQAGDLIENERLAQGGKFVDENRDAQPPVHGVPSARAQVT